MLLESFFFFLSKVSNTQIIRLNCPFISFFMSQGTNQRHAQWLRDRSSSSQFDAEFQKLIFRPTSSHNLSPAFFRLAYTSWTISVIKTAALSVFYYKTFMHCVTLVRVFAPLLWQHFCVVEKEIHLHTGGGAARQIKVWFMTPLMAGWGSIIVPVA